MSETSGSDGAPLDVSHRDDHHMTPEHRQSGIPTCMSPDDDSSSNTSQTLLDLEDAVPANSIAKDAGDAPLSEIDHQSNIHSSAQEITKAASDYSSSGPDADQHDAASSGHDDSDYQDEEGEEGDEQPQAGTFPPYAMYDSEETESIYKYYPGGFHPVHLGDILGDRYEVVHKLGQGGLGTVWLCLDTTTEAWRAVKVVNAEQSSEEMPELEMMRYIRNLGKFDRSVWEAHHISLPLDYFWLEGPNGRHICLVLEVHGPSIEGKWKTRVLDDGLARLNDMIFQIATALNFLHDKGICHGDLTPGNMLSKLKDISHLGKEEIIDLLGEPELEEVYIQGGVDPTPMAPRYKVVPVDTRCLGIENEIVISDFGESFAPSEEEVHFRGIPLRYAAPEATFVCDPQLPSDIWSLGCAILQVMANQSLTGEFQSLECYVVNLEAILGPIPEPYRTSYANKLNEMMEMEGSDWRVPKDALESNLPISALVDPPSTGFGTSYEAVVPYLEECAMKHGHSSFICALLAEEIRVSQFRLGPNETAQFLPGQRAKPLKPLLFKEVQVLGDLLGKMIKYRPEERLDINGVLRHEWFTRNRSSIDSKVTTAHEDWVASNVDKAEPTSATSTNMPINQSTSYQGSPSAQNLPTSSRLPIIQSTDPEVMGSLLDPNSGERAQTGTTQTVLQYFCVGFALVVLIPALYVYIMFLLVIPLFMRIGQRAWYS